MPEPVALREPIVVPRERDAALPLRTAAAALLLAAVAALIVPGERAGLAVALVAIAALAVGATGIRRERVGGWTASCLIAAALLAATPLYRDAEWLVAGDLVFAFALAAVALAGGRTWSATLGAPLALLGRMVEGPIAAARTALSAIPTGAAGGSLPALRAAALAAGLVCVFGLLFISADGAFAHLVDRLIPDAPSLGDLPTRVVIALLALALAGGLALIAGVDAEEAATRPAEGRLAPVEWGLALGAVVALFAAFVLVQAVVLFGGNDHVLETAGLTYAEYARQGFGQLLVVAILALGLVAGAWRWSAVTRPWHAVLLRVLLASICVLTLVIVIAALHRLDLYADAFGATRLRLEAAIACAWIGALVALVLLATLSRTRAWLPRAFVLVTAIFAIGFTLSNPDAIVADRNVDRYLEIGRIDAGYNSGLSADAVPTLATLPPEASDLVLGAPSARLEVDDGLWGLNLSRESARDALD